MRPPRSKTANLLIEKSCCAWQQNQRAHVHFGSKADIAECETNVRFYPPKADIPGGLFLDESTAAGSGAEALSYNDLVLANTQRTKVAANASTVNEPNLEIWTSLDPRGRSPDA